jgi:hypothetical protein
VPQLVEYSPEALEEPFRGTLEPFTKPMAIAHQVHTYTELRQQIDDDLRIQNPEWVQPNGESPMCDSYEARLMVLLDTFHYHFVIAAGRPKEAESASMKLLGDHR